MTDQIFYEELRATIRDAIASYLDTYTDEELRELATESLNLPPLADMTEAERKACAWMLADLPDGGRMILDQNGCLDGVPLERVTPRPDLPRMEWPGDKKHDPALPGEWRLADHQKYGRVIVTNTDPDEDGHVYFVAPAPAPLGNDWHPCDPNELTYIDTDNQTTEEE